MTKQRSGNHTLSFIQTESSCKPLNSLVYEGTELGQDQFENETDEQNLNERAIRGANLWKQTTGILPNYSNLHSMLELKFFKKSLFTQTNVVLKF